MIVWSNYTKVVLNKFYEEEVIAQELVNEFSYINRSFMF